LKEYRIESILKERIRTITAMAKQQDQRIKSMIDKIQKALDEMND